MKQVVCLGRGRPLIGLISRLNVLSRLRHRASASRPWARPPRAPGRMRVFHLDTCLHTETKARRSQEGGWLWGVKSKSVLSPLTFCPHLLSYSPWREGERRNNSSGRFLNVPWAGAVLLCFTSSTVFNYRTSGQMSCLASITPVSNGILNYLFLLATILCLSSHEDRIYCQLMFSTFIPKDLWHSGYFIFRLQVPGGRDQVVLSFCLPPQCLGQ